MNAPLIPLEDAQARLLALATPLPMERVDVESTHGRYMAHPLRARRTHPAQDTSAMDGYAVSAGDFSGPWRVVGESAAGHPWSGTLVLGDAVRVSTGAVLPDGTAAVILQEDVRRESDRLTLTGEAPEPPSRHVRRRAMDFATDAEVMPAGMRLGPAQIALALAAGHRHLPVSRRPRLAVIDCGDELASDPECCAPGQIPASNGAMLAAMARELAVDVTRIGPVPDDIAAITSAFDASAAADVIVTSGGASVGDHDLIRPALEGWGAQIDFWRVAIKPGKPILVATRARPGAAPQIILGLPGNPVSSFVTATLFLLPLLRMLLGAASPLPRSFGAELGSDIRANGRRREFQRGWWDGERVIVHPLQDSGALSPLAASNVLIDRPANAPALSIGDKAPIFLLQNGGIA